MRKKIVIVGFLVVAFVSAILILNANNKSDYQIDERVAYFTVNVTIGGASIVEDCSGSVTLNLSPSATFVPSSIPFDPDKTTPYTFRVECGQYYTGSVCSVLNLSECEPTCSYSVSMGCENGTFAHDDVVGLGISISCDEN